MTTAINDQLVLISGASATGKSASLQNIRNQERWIYLGCEAGKRLPFKNKFKSFVITDPYQVYEAFEHMEANSGDYDGIVIDTQTFLMEMFESMYVIGAADTMKGWADYAQFFKNLMQLHVARTDKAVIVMAHTLDVYNENSLSTDTKVPVKGSLKNNGIESYFSTVVSTKKVSLKNLEDYQSDILNLTDQDEMLGYKHVFQTQLTKLTIGERIRSPMGMFTTQETFMDNDAQSLIDHLVEYYE
jgi:hypothetical protein